jgi:hypothetical protein
MQVPDPLPGISGSQHQGIDASSCGPTISSEREKKKISTEIRDPSRLKSVDNPRLQLAGSTNGGIEIREPGSINTDAAVLPGNNSNLSKPMPCLYILPPSFMTSFMKLPDDQENIKVAANLGIKKPCVACTWCSATTNGCLSLD